MFDKDSFMNTTTEAELSTEFIPVPEAEYSAYIDEVKVDSFPRKEGDGDIYVMKVLCSEFPVYSTWLGRQALSDRSSSVLSPRAWRIS